MSKSSYDSRREFRARLIQFFTVVFLIPAMFMLADAIATNFTSLDGLRIPNFVPYLWVMIAFYVAIRAAFGMRKYADYLRSRAN